MVIICPRRISTLHTSSYHYGQVVRCIPMAAFRHVISSCGTVSSSNSMRKKTKLAIWRRIPHISPLLYKVYLPITEGFVNWSVMYPVQTPGCWSSLQPFIDIQPCEWDKETLVSAIDIYATFHYRSSLIPSCKVCSKPSWSCTPGSTMLTAPLKWGWPM